MSLDLYGEISQQISAILSRTLHAGHHGRLQVFFSINGLSSVVRVPFVDAHHWEQ